MEPILFKPIYQQRVWGGRGLAQELNRELPEGQIGESWEIVDRTDEQSIIRNGPFQGLSLREALQKDAEHLMGPNYDAQKPFPILVKWLDCAERLSLQVHPPASVADELGGEPKTENWYVVRTQGDAAVLAGLKEGVTREQFEKALKDETLEGLVPRLPTEAGDSLFVESGRIHAIDAGNLILEIQQNSDTTYRVYDWGRVGLDGKPRQLHIEESMKSIDFNDYEPSLTKAQDGPQTLVDSPIFRLRKLDLAPGERLDFGGGEDARLLHVVSGDVHEMLNDFMLTKGDNVLLPFGDAYAFEAPEGARVLITDRFI